MTGVSRRNLMRQMARWSLSYLTICSIATLMMTVFTFHFSRVLRQNIEETNNLQLAAVQDRADTYLEDSQKFAVTMNLNPIVSDLRKAKEEDDFSRYQLFRLVKDIAAQNLAGQSTERRLLYFPRNGLFVSGQTYGRSNAFYDMELEGWGVNQQVLEKELRPMLDERQGIETLPGGIIAIWQLLQAPGREKESAYSLILAPERDILGYRGNKPYDLVFLVNPARQKIIGGTSEGLDADTLLSAASQNQTIVAHGWRLITPIPSLIPGWSYVVASRKNPYLSPLQRLYLVLAIMLGIYIFTSVYIIIHALLKEAKVFHQTIDDRNVIEAQQTAIRRFILSRLLTEKNFAAVTSASTLEHYGLNVESNTFVLLGVASGHSLQDKEWEALRTEIIGLAKEQGLSYSSTREEGRLLLLLWESYPESRDLVGIALDIGSRVMEKHPAFLIAVSSPHQGKEHITSAFSEVRSVFPHVTGKPLAWQDMNLLPEETKLSFPADKEQRLLNCLKSGDAVGAINEIREIVQENTSKSLSDESQTFLLSVIASAIFRGIDHMHLSQKATLSYQQRLEAADQLQNLEGVAQDACDELCQIRSQEMENERNQMYLTIKRMVDTGYQDISLNVNSLAERMGARPSEISRLFNERHPVKLYQYIQQVRIAHSKAMLMKEDKLEVVARQCGFGSNRTFLRIFKQYEGVTPTTYRELTGIKGGSQSEKN